ncbi:hypothetical protein PVK63_10985 [Aliivibrio sp. S2TY2]|uniref:tetratricopeptide repeat protein n=1 Tax=unclassified Aliivibrio TaxID=2645654 RepID=UPI0023781933|nr:MULTISPECIES: hypothetical protein [unclassified Aliivibrio]MDD9175395.1 hypothetical protein [Aliivibrio sp. S3TY1]MDD9192474.1 hypothetical protein [Aliivibrio sp. S2TY2]
MLKKLLLVSTVLLLSACSSRQYSESSLTQSKIDIYEQTQNYVALSDLYKAELKKEDSEEIREALAAALLHLEDPESALFYLKPNIENGASFQSYYLQASALGDLGKYPQAIKAALLSLEENPDNPETENLLGILYGHEYQYEKSRKYFQKAQLHFYDSNTIANNLAVLDIAEGNYKRAAQRLLPVYRSGQANEQVMANLILSMAKEQNLEFIQAVLGDKHTKKEIERIYQSLQRFNSLDIDTKKSV